MKKYYLAYGNNLNIKNMKKICSSSEVIGSISINDCHLVYRGVSDGYAHLTIEMDKGSYVPLGVYEIDEKDEAKLDNLDGYSDLYHKEHIDIKVNNRTEKAIIYIMNDCLDYHTPNANYVFECLKGYSDFGFDKNLLKNALENSKKNKDIIKQY